MLLGKFSSDNIWTITMSISSFDANFRIWHPSPPEKKLSNICHPWLQQVASVCHLSNRAFSKDRDRLLVTRSAVFDLVQALKFKISLPDGNFLLLASLVLQDAGGSIQVI